MSDVRFFSETETVQGYFADKPKTITRILIGITKSVDGCVSERVRPVTNADKLQFAPQWAEFEKK